MIVVDTSTLVAFFLGGDHSGPQIRKTLGADPGWAAPPHQPVELMNVLRGLVLGRKISQEYAESALRRWKTTYIESLPLTPPVLDRMWDLRGNVTAYDAAYVAVAEAHGMALVTGDRRLARTERIRCELRLVV
ncbi:PIN domain-containing protein [Saccharopolyspora sp. NFXS83]|uniref:type II toxin-antitoxin system VapC family toxin n=1 Tax=Saccharopolyspora sp. NFXS83 TaxID=2993560 RepID=UPI00224B4362|nr:PIN domain-containing protein [Saccharopolyspora sp. NFXS83]MCX2733897.1 PIN domain-containing protein [Saccharopolyspora sp. NFXS83]